MWQFFEQLEAKRRNHGNKYLRNDIVRLQQLLRSGNVDPLCRKQLWLTVLAGVDTVCNEQGIDAEWTIRRTRTSTEKVQDSLCDKVHPSLDEYFLFVEHANRIVNSCVADETLSIR